MVTVTSSAVMWAHWHDNRLCLLLRTTSQELSDCFNNTVGNGARERERERDLGEGRVGGEGGGRGGGGERVGEGWGRGGLGEGRVGGEGGGGERGVEVYSSRVKKGEMDLHAYTHT